MPFDDPSGVRLRAWMGVSEETFYDPRQVAIAALDRFTEQLQEAPVGDDLRHRLVELGRSGRRVSEQRLLQLVDRRRVEDTLVTPPDEGFDRTRRDHRRNEGPSIAMGVDLAVKQLKHLLTGVVQQPTWFVSILFETFSLMIMHHFFEMILYGGVSDAFKPMGSTFFKTSDLRVPELKRE